MNAKMFDVSLVRTGARLSSVLAFGAIVAAFAGCASESGQSSQSAPEVTGTTARSFEQWKDTVYREPDTGIWIVDGDTPVNSLAKLYSFYETYVQQGALIVGTKNGVDAIWDAQERVNITYCVSRASFGESYDRVVQAASDAGGAWESIAAVRFVHVASQDDNCTVRNNNVVFNARVGGSSFSGRSFFPHDPRSARELLISATATSGGNPNGPESLTGLLRHELGHVLGFRHEHTRPEAGATQCFEDDNWRALTEYDSASVMHYPWCNGSNRGDLDITQLDVQGVVALYGAP